MTVIDGMILRCLAFFICSYIIYLKSRHNYNISAGAYRLIIIFFILMGVFGTGQGDYIHYEEILDRLRNGSQFFSDINQIADMTHMEPIYVVLARVVGYHYHLWRLALYSVQFIMLGHFIKRAGLAIYSNILLFTLMCLPLFITGRSGIGVMFYFFGIYLFIKEQKWYYILLIISTYWLHSSMILLLAILPCAFIKLNRFTFSISILIFPIAVRVLNMALNYAMLTNIEVLSDTSAKANTYLGADESISVWGDSFGSFIGLLLIRIPIYILIIIIIYNVATSKKSYSKEIESLTAVMYGLFYYTCLILAAGVDVGVFYSKYFIMLTIPIFIILPQLRFKNHKLYRNTYGIVVLMFVVYNLYMYALRMFYATFI